MTRPRTPRRRLRVARFVILALATVVTGAGLFLGHKLQVRREAVSLRERAAAAAVAGEWPVSASLYRNYLRLVPDDAEATEEFAASLEVVVQFHASTRVGELIGTYERLRALDRLSPGNRRKLARHNLATGRTAAAREQVQELMQAPDADPGDAELLELAAACEEQEGKPAAADFYRRAIATGKAAPESYLRLAVLTRRVATNPNAEADAEAVLADLVRARPAEVKPRLLRARYRLQQDKAQPARDDLEFAYRSIPGGADDLDVVQLLTALATGKGGEALGRGDFGLAKAEFAFAQEVLAKGLARHPDELRLQLTLADVQLQMRDAAAAKKTLLAVAARDLPPTQFALDVADRLLDLGEVGAVAALAAKYAAGDAGFAGDYLTGRLKLAEGNWPAALPPLQRAAANGLARLPTHHAQALLGLAECHGLAGNEDLRAKAVAEAVRVDPRSVRARLAQVEVLDRTGRAPEAAALAAQLAPSVPSARVALVGLRLRDALRRPEAERDWAAVEDACGPEPRPPEVNALRAEALAQQGKLPEAIALLEKAVADPEAAHLPGPRVALAYARGSQSPAAGLRVLDAAEKRVGDRPEFRMARLALTLRTGAADVRALAALGANTGPFTPAERYRLFAQLGQTFAALNRPAEAVEFTRKAAAENPFDLALRTELFRLGLLTDDAPLQAQALAEMDALEGPGSPARAVAEATRALKDVKPGEAAKLDAARALLEPARAARPNWPPVEVLLADLDLLSGRGDAALAHYRRAAELGDASEPVAANVVRLLLERGGRPEALDVLERQLRRGPLSADLTRELVVLRAAFGQEAAGNLAWARSPEVVNSKQPRDHLTRAAVLEAGGERAEARKSVETALSLNANAPESWVALVRLVVAEGKPTEAKALAEAAAKALKPPADRPEAAAEIALALSACQELVGDAARAEQFARDALAVAPSNAAAARALNRLLYRANRAAEADKLFDDLTRNDAAAPEARRYARRMLAYARVMQSGAPADLVSALDLLERNLQEGGNLVEDRRAKALVLATDPFRQPEAIDLLTESGKQSSLTAEESYHLGRMWAQQGRPDRAEAAFKDATRAVALALPEHLAALARVQASRGDIPGAAATVARLTAGFATSWEAVTEEARVLSLLKRGPEAAKKLLDSPFAADPAARLTRVAPVLEELGLAAEAEAVYRDAAKADGPTTHTQLAGFLLRAGRAAEAVELAYARESKAPVGVTARLLAAGVRVQPVALTPEATRPKWADAVRRIDEWVTAKLAANPGNPDVLFARAELDDLAGRYADEIATYEKLIALAPENEVALNNFALVLALVNRDGGERPLGMVNAVIAKRGPRAAYLDTRAIVHLAGERFDDAIRDLTVALRLDPKPAYSFHLALAEERKAGAKGSTAPRDAAVRDAVRRGLTKAMLHAKEWPDYDRLMPK